MDTPGVRSAAALKPTIDRVLMLFVESDSLTPVAKVPARDDELNVHERHPVVRSDILWPVP